MSAIAPEISASKRILVVDDRPDIHDDFRKILASDDSGAALDALEDELFGNDDQRLATEKLTIDTELQGEPALQRLVAARAEGRPFSLVFLDVRMPPGWDGVKTAREMLAADPEVQIVLCTAYTDHTWHGIVRAVGRTDRLLILRKPFDPIEVLQMAHTLTQKWDLMRAARDHQASLEGTIAQRTAQLAERNAELQQDIERRRKIEEALSASERRFHALAARAPVGIFEATPEGLWTYANDRSLEVVDGGAGQEQHASILTGLHPDDAARVRGAWERSLRDHCELDSEHRYVGSDGHTAWAEVNALPQRDAEGTLTGWIGTIADVSERKLREMQLTLSDRLTSMGTLAAGLAHEINNPLAYVSANLDMAIEHVAGGDEELVDMLGDAREGASRVRQLVAQLKSFSRVDETDRRAAVQVVPLVEASLRITANQIRHRAELKRELGITPPVLGDEGRLAQVIVNLLVNATQALPADRPDNEIQIVTRTGSEGDAIIEVKDNGSGISPAHLSRIFDPFFTTKRVGEGTGLGLSICHTIITSHGGRMEVESEVGVGTTFRVVLPAMEVAQATSSRGPATSRRQVPSARVLVVDDEPQVAAALQRTLRGHHVEVVRSGSEALAMLERSQFDLLLCDVMMPGMSGAQLFHHIQQSWPELARRVVFMSGGAFTPETQSFLDSVTNPRLAKPFDVTEVRRMVAKHAGKSAAPA